MKKNLESFFPPAAIVHFSDPANMQLPDPDMVQFYNDINRRIYWLEDEISSADAIFVKRLIDWNIEDYGLPKEERKPIYLMIDTPGGDLYVTLTLIDAIRASETPVIGIVTGTAYSGGFYVLLACDKRWGLKHSSYMVHKGSGELGNADQAAAAEAMKQWQAQINTLRDFVVERTNMPLKDVNKALRTDTYLSADRALEKGVLTHIIDSINEIAVVMAGDD